MVIRQRYDTEITRAFKSLPIVVLIGARQVGKTTIMTNYQYDKEHILLDGQDAEHVALFSSFTTIASYLQVQLDTSLDAYLLIDEFQYIPNISVTLKLLVDRYPKLKIVVSGSSSIDIIQRVKESLAGRVRMINVYSLSFAEYIQFQDNKLYAEFKKYDVNTQDIIVNKKIGILLSEYLLYGGMPRVALAKKTEDKQELLNDIYQTYLMRDVKSYVKNEDTVGFNKLLRIISAQISNLYNVNELAKSCGLQYKKVEEYLYLLEQMYIIRSIAPIHSNLKKTITKMRKLYFYDVGMRNVVYGSFNDIEIRVDNGAIFENFVLLELLKKENNSTKLNFYRTKDGVEIDFILDNMKKKVSLEVKYKHLDKKESLRSLINYNKSEEIDESYLVNLNLNDSIDGINYIQGYLLGNI